MDSYNLNSGEIDSLIEFFVFSLSKTLLLKPSQAAVLFGQNNKYLGHILVKGVKGEFHSLCDWI